jgi:hypothetical protein
MKPLTLVPATPVAANAPRALAAGACLSIGSNGHDFEKTPQGMKVMPVPLAPAPRPHSGRGGFRESLRDFHVKRGGA